ncbi:hypothetical protein [Polaribacter sp.]|uniref:hypothetical protein n=1 Tax=Polaribacter sp. TaxID=1920175 RepID=UPI003F6D8204
MKDYKSFKEIEQDLKLHSLEKDIALEELKIIKNDFENQLKPLSLLGSAVKFASKYGLLVLVKKIFKK